MMTIDLPSDARILVIALRRLGDVLLTTPLVRSIRRNFPGAKIDVLVFSGTEGILDGNPDIDGLVVMNSRSTVVETLVMGRRLWRTYNLAISTQTGDRPTLFAWVAASRRAGPVETSGLGAHLKRLLFQFPIEVSPGLHRVEEVLRLADALGVPRVPQVIGPHGTARPGLKLGHPYAVIHAGAMFGYKRWTTEGWRRLAAALVQRGLALVATGGPMPAEQRYLDEVWGGFDVAITRLDGRLSWPELGALIAHAQTYVGPDTSITHLAAASGCPTVALYGPTDPRLWGPWPASGLEVPWAAAGTVQRRGNVWLVQNPLPCMPCQLEGCERHLESFSQCLDEMPVDRVLGAVDEALASHAGAGGSGQSA